MKDIIYTIFNKHTPAGVRLNAPVLPKHIANFERRTRFNLPEDFVTFYSICNGFECDEDLFNMIPLSDIIDYGTDWFYFAEYMIYADMWAVRLIGDGKYEIFNDGCPDIVLTRSLEGFLSSVLKGNVFEKGGLYDWLEELKGKAM